MSMTRALLAYYYVCNFIALSSCRERTIPSNPGHSRKELPTLRLFLPSGSVRIAPSSRVEHVFLYRSHTVRKEPPASDRSFLPGANRTRAVPSYSDRLRAKSL
ncbi:hypothetical protein BDV06DRAFT_201114 [Aspergillus oleicola]